MSTMPELVDVKRTKVYREVKSKPITITLPGEVWYDLLKLLREVAETSHSYYQIERVVLMHHQINEQFKS